ncbi:MAG: glycogen/starch synthase, partial [Proteobacteria bacterium]|nr:glycogen/starch synthase [Pseudomonadota bacterium]
MSLESANRDHKKTAVLLIAPETGRLPNGMGPLARFISGKSGGLGDVIATLCEGLTQRGIECHLATLNLTRRFQQENNLSDDQWEKAVHTIDPEHIHLVNSALFDNLTDAYAGNPILSAAEFQKTLVNQIINRIRAKNGGRLIIHSHDWMAGGVITADARRQGCPVLHTLHNVHTSDIPLELFAGVDTAKLSDYLYRPEWGKPSVDCQATAIKNASLVNFVGARFLSEIVNDLVPDQSVIPPSVRREVKAKYEHGSTRTIINAPSLGMYPEHGEHLIRKYGPEDDVIVAKRENLVEFQR